MLLCILPFVGFQEARLNPTMLPIIDSASKAIHGLHAGLRYLMLVVLGRDREWLASWLAITAALLHFLHNAGLEAALDQYGFVSRRRLQRLTEVAHMVCVLKVLSDLGTNATFDFSFAIGGKSCSK